MRAAANDGHGMRGAHDMHDNIYKRRHVPPRLVEKVARTYLFILIGAGLLIAACAPQSVICNKPYILKGTECCLDTNGNGICDVDEGLAAAPNSSACPKLDCGTCPPQIVERNITATRYVCTKDGRIVQTPGDCSAASPNPFANYTLVTWNSTAVQSFTVRPACRDGQQAVEVHFTVGSTTPEVLLEVKDAPQADYTEAYTYTGGATDKYVYGVFCTSVNCAANKDFVLAPDRAYVIRGRFDYRGLFGTYEYSDELFMDARSSGEFMTKLCS
jgi:hypothetical protein